MNTEKLQAFVELLTKEQVARVLKEYPSLDPARHHTAHLHLGKKYARVDVGDSGKYTVDAEGNIWGIKAYGVIHRGHHYGTLDTTSDWDWGGYVAVRREKLK